MRIGQMWWVPQHKRFWWLSLDCYDKMPQTGWLANTKISFWSRIQRKGAIKVMKPLGSQSFSVYPHMGEGLEMLWHLLLSHSFTQGSTLSQPNLLKVTYCFHHLKGLGFLHMNLGTKHSGYGSVKIIWFKSWVQEDSVEGEMYSVFLHEESLNQRKRHRGL